MKNSVWFGVKWAFLVSVLTGCQVSWWGFYEVKSPLESSGKGSPTVEAPAPPEISEATANSEKLASHSASHEAPLLESPVTEVRETELQAAKTTVPEVDIAQVNVAKPSVTEVKVVKATKAEAKASVKEAKKTKVVKVNAKKAKTEATLVKPATAQSTTVKQVAAKPVIEKTAVVAGGVQGTITLLGVDGRVVESKNIIVSIVPDSVSIAPRAVKNHIITMRNKIYKPSHLAVQVGDKVTFVNQDRLKHNVFSSSAKNRFDLGTYKRGKRPAIEFQNAGLVKVYCNLHKRMATYINVMETDRSAITDVDGFFFVGDLPPGKYKLKAWHLRGTIQKTFVVSPANTVNFDLTIDGSNFVAKTRTGKSGAYPTAPVKKFNADDYHVEQLAPAASAEDFYEEF